jgi:hypothetical protein
MLSLALTARPGGGHRPPATAVPAQQPVAGVITAATVVAGMRRDPATTKPTSASRRRVSWQPHLLAVKNRTLGGALAPAVSLSQLAAPARSLTGVRRTSLADCAAGRLLDPQRRPTLHTQLAAQRRYSDATGK